MSAFRLRPSDVCVPLLLLLGCPAPNQAHIQKLQGPVSTAEGTQTKPTYATLISYDVVAPQDRATLLIEYCQRTKLAAESNAGVTRCGPFLSRYEAAFIAGLVPGATTRVHDQYLDGARVDPWLKPGSPYARTPVYVGTRLVAGHRFALVTWELEGDAAVAMRHRLEAGSDAKDAPVPKTAEPGSEPNAPEKGTRPVGQPASKKDARTANMDSKPASNQDAKAAVDNAKEPGQVKHAITEQELYEVVGAGPRFMTRLPWLDARQSASGLAFVELADEGVFLEVKAAHREGAISERLAAFQWSLNGSEAVFDRQLLTLEKKGETELELSVTRISPAPLGLDLASFKATFSLRPEAKGLDLALNDWSFPRWKTGKDPASRMPDLVDLKSVESAGSKFESLESLDAAR